MAEVLDNYSVSVELKDDIIYISDLNENGEEDTSTSGVLTEAASDLAKEIESKLGIDSVENYKVKVIKD
jgi:hypothetical protein